MRICKGMPSPLGAYVLDSTTVNMAVVLNLGLESGVYLYNRTTGEKHTIAFGEENRIGKVYCIRIEDINPEEYEYTFFQGEEEFCDPYAREVVGNEKWGKSPDKLRGRLLPRAYYGLEGKREKLSFEDSYIYLLHVRGFTKHSSSGVSNPGTYSGIVEKLPYLKELGITTVMLMPTYEFVELEAKKTQEQIAANVTEELEPRLNYWGFKPGFYLAPKSSYAEPGVPAHESFAKLVKAVHESGMEIMLQFFFGRDIKPSKVVEIVKYWVTEYDIDGFNLCGERIPIANLGNEPLLADTKLLVNSVNGEEIYCHSKPENKNIAVFNDDYMYVARRFLKSDEGQLDPIINHLRWFNDSFARVHYLTNYNGFTLMDLVSFDRKHNELNGENNRDGNTYNASWNCGAEGSTVKKSIKNLRKRQIRNAIAISMMTKSTPMILAGDEMGNSQKGNNNPYCQDNNVTWLNWKNLERNDDIYRYFKSLIAFRKNNSIICTDKAFKMHDYMSIGCPDLSYHSESPWRLDGDYLTRHFGVLFNRDYEPINCLKGEVINKGRGYIFVAFNMHWTEHIFALPNVPVKRPWKKICDSVSGYLDEPEVLNNISEVTVADRCVTIFTC